MSDDGIRSDCFGIALAVNLYSWICLFLSGTLVCMLHRYGERFTYVALFTATLSVSTFASIIQQLHFMISWKSVQEQKYEASLQPVGIYNTGAGTPTNTMDIVLYEIQFYCYNVSAMLVLCWAAALFRGSWGFKVNWMGDWYERMGLISKIASYTLPLFVITMMSINAIVAIRPLYYTVTNILLAFSLLTGSVLLVLILTKYVKTRRLLIRPAARSRWWYSGGDSTKGTSYYSSQPSQQLSSTGGNTEVEQPRKSRRAIYDRSLVIRFTIAFVLLAAFEIAIIAFQFTAMNAHSTLSTSGGADLTYGTTVTSLIQVIPGVTASLAVFLVLGTTKSWTQYKDLYVTFFRRCLNCCMESRSTKNMTRVDDEAQLRYRESFRTPSSRPPPSPSLCSSDGSTMEMVNVTNNQTNDSTTSKANFSKPFPQRSTSSTSTLPIMTAPAPVVFASTTIEIESHHEESMARRDREYSGYKAASMATTTVTSIRANNPYVPEDPKSVAFHPKVYVRGQSQESLRTPDFYWDSASDKAPEVTEKSL